MSKYSSKTPSEVPFMSTIRNIVKNLIKPNFAPVMIEKVYQRFFDHSGLNDMPGYMDWLRKNVTAYDTFAGDLSPDLLKESKLFAEETKRSTEKVGPDLWRNMGRGGHYALLFFLTRYLRPETVVETGVSAGLSTQAFLKAMQMNEKGRLYSSDFPLFRMENPEKNIGIMVDPKLKDRWELFLDGDKINLDKICGKISKIDLFHYDSDKRYSGRKRALNTVSKLFHPKTVIIFDDIQDNRHFADFIRERNAPFQIFEFEEKFVGLSGI